MGRRSVAWALEQFGSEGIMYDSPLVFGPEDLAAKVAQVTRRRFLSTALGGAVSAGTFGSFVLNRFLLVGYDSRNLILQAVSHLLESEWRLSL